MAGNANKIKLFKFIQKTYHYMGIDPPQRNQNSNPINLKKWFIQLSLAQLPISSAAYLVFETNSMIEYGMVFLTCVGLGFCFILYLIFFWQIEIISNFIENCERFIEKRAHSTIAYKSTNEKIERLTAYFAYAMLATAIFEMLLPLLYTIVNYNILDAEKESFFLIVPTWLPFDWKTPIGYMVAWLLQFTGALASAITVISILHIVFASCYLFIVIVDDITNDVAAFNDTVRRQKDRSDHVAELMERFYDIMQNYSDEKQLINDFNNVCEYSLFAFFVWNMLSVSCSLVTLQFQLWSEDSKLFEILILAMIVWIFVLNLVICEPGQRVTNQFDQFGVEFGRCEWNKLPIKVQRMYLIFLSDTQQPKHIRSYGGIECTRETFKQITNKGFSYFMTLRNFRT